MPARNVVKNYVEDGYYHVYNRGVEKRIIFEDPQDYGVFLNRVKLALTPVKNDDEIPQIKRLNYAGQIKLIAYCLMPNHFHLLIKQKSNSAMEGFIRTICTSYSMYFNKRYIRVGRLFQGTYKAVLVETDKYLTHLSRYIHLNPQSLRNTQYKSYPYSSYHLYSDPPGWLKPKVVLDMFPGPGSYEEFVADTAINSTKILEELTLDDQG